MVDIGGKHGSTIGARRSNGPDRICSDDDGALGTDIGILFDESGCSAQLRPSEDSRGRLYATICGLQSNGCDIIDRSHRASMPDSDAEFHFPTITTVQ